MAADGWALWKRMADLENVRKAQGAELRETYWRKRWQETWEAEMDEVRVVEDRKRLKFEMISAAQAMGGGVGCGAGGGEGGSGTLAGGKRLVRGRRHVAGFSFVLGK